MEAAGIVELVQRVTSAIEGVGPSAGSPRRAEIVRLDADWEALVKALSLSPAPDKVCPRCGRLGMAAATLCGYCWNPLTPEPKRPGAEVKALDRMADDGGPS